MHRIGFGLRVTSCEFRVMGCEIRRWEGEKFGSWKKWAFNWGGYLIDYL